MSGVLGVMLTGGGVYVILRGIRDGWTIHRHHRHDNSFLAAHERDVAYRQREREITESRRIGWRR